MKHTLRHDLGKDLACRATRKAIESYAASLAQYDPQCEWVRDDFASVRFTVLGHTLTGGIEVQDEAIVLDLEVPLVWQVFRGIAVRVIEDEIRRWIEKARSGALDG